MKKQSSHADDLNNAVSQIRERGTNGGAPQINDPRDQKLPQNNGRSDAAPQGNHRQGEVAQPQMTGESFPQQRISTQHLRGLPKYDQPGSGGANIQRGEKR